jgi:hypothetical protein
MPKKLEKTLREMPENAKRTLFHLVNDIGLVQQPGWLSNKSVQNAPHFAVFLAVVVQKLKFLNNSIQETGPVRPEYQNYRKLGKDLYHCHLAYSWVAVWRSENGSYVVEVEYVGSREKAPY